MTTEPSPHRDLGPYESREQVAAQVNAQLHGIPDPGPGGRRAVMLLAEALALAGIATTLTDYEREQVADIAGAVGPIAAQQIGAWIVRASTQGPAAEELAELRVLFDLQQQRMSEATARWRAEDPEARAHVLPDLGVLLTWLMQQADRGPGADPQQEG